MQQQFVPALYFRYRASGKKNSNLTIDPFRPKQPHDLWRIPLLAPSEAARESSIDKENSWFHRARPVLRLAPAANRRSESFAKRFWRPELVRSAIAQQGANSRPRRDRS